MYSCSYTTREGEYSVGGDWCLIHDSPIKRYIYAEGTCKYRGTSMYIYVDWTLYIYLHFKGISCLTNQNSDSWSFFSQCHLCFSPFIV